MVEGRAGPGLLSVLRAGDLVVVGVRSRHRLTARMLGSTASHVLAHVTGSVVLVPPEAPFRAGPFAGHVVVAVHGGEDDAVPTAFAEGAAHHWPVAVVHADHDDDGPTGSVIDERVLEVVLVPHPASYGPGAAERGLSPLSGRTSQERRSDCGRRPSATERA